jgi:hypothetical protein
LLMPLNLRQKNANLQQSNLNIGCSLEIWVTTLEK